jgi:TatA/E family protein of Tat protein translocase
VFNVGVPEIILVLFVALMVFGPTRLPEIARNVGKLLRNFQSETNRALSDLKEGMAPATAGIFDEPDGGSEQAASGATIPFTAAEAMGKKPPRRAGVASPRIPAGGRKPAASARKAVAKKPGAKKPAARKPAARKTPATKRPAKKK